jgi:hypothetical protein
VLAGLIRALTCADVEEGGMQWLQTYKPSRLSSGGVGRDRAEAFPLLAQFRGWAVRLDPPAEAGVNWAARRACAGIFSGPVLRDVNARTPLLTCGVLVRGFRCGTSARSIFVPVTGFGARVLVARQGQPTCRRLRPPRRWHHAIRRLKAQGQIELVTAQSRILSRVLPRRASSVLALFPGRVCWPWPVLPAD